MTFPFHPDPAPPGHGEPVHEEYQERRYVVISQLANDEPTVEKRFASLFAALTYRDKLRRDLRDQDYEDAFVGVQDEDDPGRGWLTEEDIGVV